MITKLSCWFWRSTKSQRAWRGGITGFVAGACVGPLWYYLILFFAGWITFLWASSEIEMNYDN